MSLKPSAKQMLLVAKDCGLNTISEAYGNYMCHYDLFFLISDYENQSNNFHSDLIESGLTELVDGKDTFKDMTIDDALLLIA